MGTAEGFDGALDGWAVGLREGRIVGLYVGEVDGKEVGVVGISDIVGAVSI